jgi:hypothetical protein
MGNLNRNITKMLMNSVSAADVAVISDGDNSGRKNLLLKKFGVCIPGNLATDAYRKMKVNVMLPKAGVKQVSTLAIAKKYNPNVSSYEFSISIVRKAKFDGFTNEVIDVMHTYDYVKTNFTTNSAGAFDAADVHDILSTLAERINADKSLGANHVSTGAAVVATLDSDSAATLLTLTSKEYGVAFEVRVDSDYFTLTNTVAAKNPSGTYEQVARIFSVREEHAGTTPVTAIPGATYALVEIVQYTPGYDNVVATGYNMREQRYHLYVHNDYVYDPEDTDDVKDSLTLIAALYDAALEDNFFVDGVQRDEVKG